MAGIRITAKTKAAQEKIKRVAEALKPANIDAVIGKAAAKVQADLIRKTPKRWFGKVRRGWIIVKPADGKRIVTNENKIMLFLEEGTRAHGPVRAKALYLPLTRRAVNATAGQFRKGTVNQFSVKGKTYWEQRRAIFNKSQYVRQGKTITRTQSFVYGVDYILSKWVRGIKAMHIVKNYRAKAQAIMLGLFKIHIRDAIKG